MNHLKLWLLTLSIALLSACGGGGSDTGAAPPAPAANTAPVANAGAAQSLMTNTTATLDGSASSDANGDLLTYAWTLTSKPVGSLASLSLPTTPMPTFIADVAGAYMASLTVNDGKVNSGNVATVNITASMTNAAPVANAGVAQNVVAGSVVTLDGSASSDANSDPLTYAWTLTSKPAGSTAALSSTTSAKPTFTAEVAGTYVASVIVNDGKVNSTAATVSITAAVANVAPVANAGVAQNVVAGSVVTLDGSASSDANSDPLTYAWTLTSKPAGSTAALSSTTSAKPTFTADVAGTYVASVVVNDGKVSSTTATTSVAVVDVKKIGVGYLARNGMTVTLISFTTTDLGNGYNRYTATYKEENNTVTAIDQATLRLYFTNASPAAQYGFFGRILPGAAFAQNSSYTFDILKGSSLRLLQYDADHFFADQPVPGALQWLFPIQ